MAYKLSSLNKIEDFNFMSELKALLKLLTTTWDIKAAPKGYAAFMKTYQDYQGMEEIEDQTEALLKSFDGHGDGSISSHSLVVRLTKEHVGYEDRNQVNGGPLEVLISSLLTHGIILGQRLAEFDKHSEPYQLISQIQHVFMMCGGFDTDSSIDKEMEDIYRQEFEALMLGREDLKTITNKFEDMRDALNWSRFIPVMIEYIRKQHSFVAYMGTQDKELAKIFGYIHTQEGTKKRFEEFIKKMKTEYAITIEKDGQHAYKIQIHIPS